MADFDSMWDDDMGVNVDNLDATIDISNKVSNSINKSKDTNKKSELDKNAEYLDGEEWDNLSKEEQADRFISTVERVNKGRYSKWVDKLNNKIDYLIDKLHLAKQSNAPTGKLVKQLQQLRTEYMDMLERKAADEYSTDITKAKALGLINPDQGDEFLINRQALKRELDSGKYKYTSTNF